MTTTIKLTDTFHTTVERAFKCPILGDATKFLDGYRLQPPVTGFEEDDSWGQVNGIRYPVTNGSLWLPKGRLLKDEILERNENVSWKWTIYDFKIPLMFFAGRAVGEWKVTAREANVTDVYYAYTFYSKNTLYHPFTMLFCHFQWKGMMKKALRGIKRQCESGALLVYE